MTFLTYRYGVDKEPIVGSIEYYSNNAYIYICSPISYRYDYDTDTV